MELIIPPELRRFDNPHQDALLAALGPAGLAAAFTAPDCDVLLICFANRSGSFYLAQLLAAGGACNEAGEYFNAPTVLEHCRKLGLTSLAGFVQALPAILGHPPRLAAKAGIGQLVMLHDAGILQKLLPRTRFLLIERADRLGQAISRVIAQQNLKWSSEHSAIIDDDALVYDRAAIAQEWARADYATFGFYRLFAANGIVPIHVGYEELLADPAAVLADIGTQLGIGPIPYRPQGVRLVRQANAINAAWRERYLRGD